MSGRIEGFPGGEPLADVPVRVMDPQGRTAVGRTDAAGAFVVSDVEEGWQRVQARPEGERLSAWFPDTYSFCGAERIRVDEEHPAEGLVFTLPSGGSLEGEVYDDLGLPIEGAAVTARGLDFYNQELSRSGLTDEAGRYRLDGLDSIQIDGVPLDGAYRLTVDRPGGATWYWPGSWRSIDAEPVGASRGEVRTVDLTLAAPGALQGRVLDASGPRPGVAVRAVFPSSLTPVIDVTGADGSYRLLGIDADRATVVASAPGFAPTWLPSLASGGELIDLLPGEVSAAPDLVLLPGAGLEVDVVMPPGAARLTLTRSEDGTWLGGATLADSAVLLFEDLPPGEVSVQLQALDPFGVAPRGPDLVSLAAGETAELRVQAEAGVVLSGRVFGRGGRALTGAVVDALDPTSGEVLASARSESGDFAVGPLWPGAFLLRARWQAFCSSDPAWVEVYAPDARRIEDATSYAATAGEALVLDDLALPPDGDADGMDDVWELAWHLDPLAPDGDADADGDGASNRQEYREGTDPRGWTAPADCAGGGGIALFFALLGRRRRRV